MGGPTQTASAPGTLGAQARAKGNVDLAKLEALVQEHGAEKIAYISFELSVNMAGGQPEADRVARFRALLEGREVLGRLDRDWAAVRLLEHASWREIRRLMRLGDLVRGWPKWRARVRSSRRRRGFDFLVEWLPRHHPELL